MDLNEAIIGRRAVREYTDEAVDERTVRSLIDAAARPAQGARGPLDWLRA